MWVVGRHSFVGIHRIWIYLGWILFMKVNLNFGMLFVVRINRLLRDRLRDCFLNILVLVSNFWDIKLVWLVLIILRKNIPSWGLPKLNIRNIRSLLCLEELITVDSTLDSTLLRPSTMRPRTGWDRWLMLNLVSAVGTVSRFRFTRYTRTC